MSQSDSFIDEVTEEVRRDRLFALMRRYGWIAIAVIVLIVGAAAWNEYRKAQDRAAAEALGDALLSALEQDTPAERVAALDAVPAEAPGQIAIRALLEASEAAADGDPEAAADTLTQVADLPDLPPVYRRIAQFKALGYQAATRPAAERRAAYEDLVVPGSELRLLAQEQIALTYIEEGDTAAALDICRQILDDAQATAGLRQRVSQLMVALGADPDGQDAAPDNGE